MPPLTADGVKPVSLRTGSSGGKRNVVWMHIEEMPGPGTSQPMPLRLIEGQDPPRASPRMHSCVAGL